MILKKAGVLNRNNHLNEQVSEKNRRKLWLKLRILALSGLFLALTLLVRPISGHLTPFEAPARKVDQSGVGFSTLSAEAGLNQPPSPTPTQNDSLFERLFGSQPSPATTHESWSTRVIKALLSFALAALLAAMLAFRPRKDISIFRPNPFIAQTQILLAVVGAAMMIVIADNAARVFGIFAAAALIRFRTNIRDPKEITVLLVSLSIGLASGVGRWELATALALFVMLILWPLERFELTQVFRAMELEVKTYNLGKTNATLKKIFKKHRINAELRKIDPEDDEDSPGTILYYLNLSPDLR